MKLAALNQPRLSASPRRLRALTAFTLLEVMIALGIFFMCIFAILEVVVTNVRSARYLQQQHVDVGLLVADLCQTNKLQEGNDSGDFGDLFPGYTWESETSPAGTNGLFKVDFRVTRKGGGKGGGGDYEDKLSVLLWRPDSPQRGTGLLPH